MKKYQAIAQVYGYLVCLVTVITVLICVTNIISALIDNGDPLHVTDGFYNTNQNLSSFEVYKLDKIKPGQKADSTSQSYLPSENEMLAMYNTEKENHIAIVKHRNKRTIVESSAITLLAILLFATHWVWLRRLSRTES